MRFALMLLVLALAGAGAARAQTAPSATPGFTAPPAAQSAQPVAAPAAPPEHSHAEVTKKARPGRDVTIGSYLTIDKACKIGDRPSVTITEQPKGGKVRTRNDSMNLAHAAGVPRNKCLGVSPAAIAVVYQSLPKAKLAEDSFAYQVKYPDGRERDVKVTVTLQ